MGKPYQILPPPRLPPSIMPVCDPFRLLLVLSSLLPTLGAPTVSRERTCAPSRMWRLILPRTHALETREGPLSKTLELRLHQSGDSTVWCRPELCLPVKLRLAESLESREHSDGRGLLSLKPFSPSRYGLYVSIGPNRVWIDSVMAGNQNSSAVTSQCVASGTCQEFTPNNNPWVMCCLNDFFFVFDFLLAVFLFKLALLGMDHHRSWGISHHPGNCDMLCGVQQVILSQS